MSNQNYQNSSMSSTNLIPTSLIQNLVDNYRSNQLLAINQDLSIQDSHSVWFDLPTLKNFVAEIEAQAKLIDLTVKDSDLGIRFYYAAYPAVPQSPVPANYAKRHTLVMIPTKKLNDLNYDFNPFDNNSVSLAVTGVSIDALALNHGTLVPPSTSIVQSY